MDIFDVKGWEGVSPSFMKKSLKGWEGVSPSSMKKSLKGWEGVSPSVQLNFEPLNALINQHSLTMHVITQDNYDTYSPFLQNLRICNQLVKPIVETLTYESIEDSPYKYGILMTKQINNNTQVVCCLLIDFECETTRDHLPDVVLSKTSLEICLACSHPVYRIPQLMNTLFRAVFNKFNNWEIWLWVSQPTHPDSALPFYRKLGFTHVPNTNYAMVITPNTNKTDEIKSVKSPNTRRRGVRVKTRTSRSFSPISRVKTRTSRSFSPIRSRGGRVCGR